MAGGRKRVVKKETVEVEEVDEPVVKKGRGGGARQRTAKAADVKKVEEQQEPEGREEEETTPTTTKKNKRGAGKATKPKEEVEQAEPTEENHEMEVEEPTGENHEVGDEDEDAPVSEPEVRRGTRVRKPVIQPEEEVIPIVSKKRRPALIVCAGIQENNEPTVTKEKRGRKAAIKTEEEEETAPATATIKQELKEEVALEEEEATPEPATSKKGKRGPGKATKVKKEKEGEEEAAAAPGPSKRGKRGPGKAAKVKEEVEEEEEDETSPAPAPSKKGKRGPGKASKVKNEPELKIEESPASDSTTQEKGEVASSAKLSGGRNAKPKVSRGKKGVAKTVTAEEKENTDTSNLTTKSGKKTGVDRVVVVKGRAAVDALCPIAQKSHVYEDGDDIWDCMLNQTNIQFNNNKYYLIQLLEDDSSRSYSVWMRWGRVGANGQNSLQACGSDLQKAMKIFEKKFSDKTKNDWCLRDMFEKVPGKYDLLKMDYSKETDTPDSGAAINKVKKAVVECLLHPKVRAVIELICDVRLMEEAVVEMKYDAQKAPLGKLTADQIKSGYLALKRIDDLVQSDKFATKDLVQACNDFYTRVPHYFGMKVPPLIRTKAEIQEKVALLETLGDIQAALSVLDQPIDVNTHPADQHYSGLKCDLTPLGKDSEEYKIIEKYMKTTHASTHNQYTLELLDVLVCYKDIEHKRFKDVGNRMLLWHGSRMSNWAGILSQGLRIAPPEAPVTGYMFGKGIYFADMSSKSANYCWANSRSNTGFLLLSEVALGKSRELLQADYNADKLPKGCHSVKGCGRTAPPSEKFTKLPDGTVVPLGPGVRVTSKTDSNYSLLYNEYIVYDPAQVLTRFLLKVQFNFK